MSEYAQLRAAAKRVGLIIKKSRCKIKTANDLCGHMLLKEKRNACVHGSRRELTAAQVSTVEKPAYAGLLISNSIHIENNTFAAERAQQQ